MMKKELTSKVDVRFEELDVVRYGPRMNVPLYVVHELDDRDVRSAAARSYAQHSPGEVATFTRGLGHRRLLKDPPVVQDVAEYVASAGRTDRVSELASWFSAMAPSD